MSEEKKIEKGKLKALRIFLIIDVFIGWLFAALLIFFPENLLGFINWPYTDPVAVMLFGGGLFSIIAASFLIIFKDEWKEIHIIMEVEIVWLLIGGVMLILAHTLFGFPISSWYLDAIVIGLFISYISIYLWVRE